MLTVEVIQCPVPVRPWVVGRGIGNTLVSFDTADAAVAFAVGVCGVAPGNLAVRGEPPNAPTVAIEGGHVIGLSNGGRCIHCGNHTERIRSHGYSCAEFQRKNGAR